MLGTQTIIDIGGRFLVGAMVGGLIVVVISLIFALCVAFVRGERELGGVIFQGELRKGIARVPWIMAVIGIAAILHLALWVLALIVYLGYEAVDLGKWLSKRFKRNNDMPESL